MFDSERPDAYEKVYQGLLPRLAAADLAAGAEGLGLRMQDGAALVPCLGAEYLVGRNGISLAGGKTPHVNHRIVLAYYLLHGGRGENAGRYAPYRELPGGADFARTLEQLVDARLARSFSGRPEALEAAARAIGGRPAPEAAAGDVVSLVPALPGIPLLFSFYDADEDFPAQAKVLYDLTAPNFLDLECLAVLGLLLVQELEARAA